MTTATHRDREFARVRSHYAWSEDEATSHFADYRGELLDEIEACLVCRAITSDADVLDSLESVIAKLRGVP
jgi:hypothetical protein